MSSRGLPSGRLGGGGGLLDTPPSQFMCPCAPLSPQVQTECVATASQYAADGIPAVGRLVACLQQQDVQLQRWADALLRDARAMHREALGAREGAALERRRLEDAMRVLRMENASLKALLGSANAAMVTKSQREAAYVTLSPPKLLPPEAADAAAACAMPAPETQGPAPPRSASVPRGSPIAIAVSLERRPRGSGAASPRAPALGARGASRPRSPNQSVRGGGSYSAKLSGNARVAPRTAP